jgi:hypothetical protein
MKRLFIGLRNFLLGLWFEIKSWPERTKRIIWNRGIKLQWHRLWIRKDEFHSSLDMDVNAMLDMDEKQLKRYLGDLDKRRQISHETLSDLIKE